MEENKVSHEENLVRACLIYKNKSYPVYNGLNTVGRNPDALINLKNLSISKFHATIIVLDSNEHYIGDFKSSNGTCVDGVKLIPLKLCKLENGAAVTFGDVFCTYKILSEKDEPFKTNSENTQSFSNSFYGACTQNMGPSAPPERENLDEMRTQCFPHGVSLDDMETQIFENSINKTIERCDDMQESGKDNEKQNAEASGATTIPDNSSNTTVHECEDDTFSQIRPVRISSKVIASDSSDTEDNLDSEQGRSKYNISDDSETDVEDDKENRPGNEATDTEESHTPANAQLELTQEIIRETLKTITKKLIPADHLYCQALSQTQQPDIESNIPGTSSAEEPPDDSQATQIFEMNEKLSDDEKKIKIEEEGKSLLDPIASSTQKTIDDSNLQPLEQNQDDNNEEEDADEFDFLFANNDACLENTECGNKVDESEKLSPQNEDVNLSSPTLEDASKDKQVLKDVNNAEDISSHSTQLLHATEIREEFPQTDDDIFLQPTQTLEFHSMNTENSSTFEKDDDIFLQPTQIIEASIRNSESQQHATGENLETNKGNDEDTQTLEDPNPSTSAESLFKSPEVGMSPSIRRSKHFLENKSPLTDNDDSFLIQPTQALELMHEPEKRYHQVEDAMQGLFASQSMLCTQQLVSVLDETVNDESIIEDSIVLETPRKHAQMPTLENIEEILSKDIDNYSTKEKEIISKDLDKTETVSAHSEGQNDADNVRKIKDRNTKCDEKKSLRKRKSDVQDNIETNSQNSSSSSENNNVTKRNTRRKIARIESNDDSTNDNETIVSKSTENEVEATLESINEKHSQSNKKRSQTSASTSQNSSQSSNNSGSGKRRRTQTVSENATNTESERTTRRGKRTETQEKDTEATNKIESRKSNRKTKQTSTSSLSSLDDSQKSMERMTRSVKRQEDKSSLASKKASDETPSNNRRRQSKKSLQDAGDPEGVDKINKGKLKNTEETTIKEKSETTPTVTKKRGRLPKNSIETGTNSRIYEPNTRSKRKTQGESLEDATKSGKNETPIKAPQKRILSTNDGDSDEDFELKDPKIELSNKKTRSKAVDESSSSVNKSRRLSANSRQKKKEEEERKNNQRTSTTLMSPERSRRIIKHKVVFTMMESPELESLVWQLGGSVVDSIDAATVLVTQTVKRSQKLLCAVAQGKPICGTEWLATCKKTSSFVDPWKYIILDKEAQHKWNFSLEESINRGLKTKLLQNYTFQIMANNGADVLKAAIEACGGKCVGRNLAKAESEHLYIVSLQNNKSKYSKIVSQNSKIKVIEPEVIFDGTLRQEFHFEN